MITHALLRYKNRQPSVFVAINAFTVKIYPSIPNLNENQFAMDSNAGMGNGNPDAAISSLELQENASFCWPIIDCN